jgi:hypothetical protein
VYLFDVVVGLSQWSASLASLESLGVPSCVGRPRLDVTVVHLSGWMVSMLFGCPCKAPGNTGVYTPYSLVGRYIRLSQHSMHNV